MPSESRWNIQQSSNESLKVSHLDRLRNQAAAASKTCECSTETFEGDLRDHDMAQWWRRDVGRCTPPDENGRLAKDRGTKSPDLPLFRAPHSLLSWRCHEGQEESSDIAAVSDPRERPDDSSSSRSVLTSSAGRPSSSGYPVPDSRSTVELGRGSKCCRRIHFFRNLFPVRFRWEGPKGFRGSAELLRQARRLQGRPSQGWIAKFVWKAISK